MRTLCAIFLFAWPAALAAGPMCARVSAGFNDRFATMRTTGQLSPRLAMASFECFPTWPEFFELNASIIADINELRQ